jgi:superfamily I DNA/RNA helicase
MKQRPRPPFDYVVVDEAQDLSVAQLKFLAAMGDGRANSLFFAGDLGQRIFQQPFSWKSLGVDVRGRSKTLKVNYRTSHQIRSQADRLLGSVVSDVDGIEESRKGTVSVFNGPVPEVVCAESEAEEAAWVSAWLKSRAAEGVNAEEMAVFVRSKAELTRAEGSARASGLGGVFVGTMHDAKGLEFRAVAVMACDDEIIPLQSRIDEVGDNADLEEVYTTERHLLYVAATRARDHLLLTSSSRPSEFLDDFRG